MPAFDNKTKGEATMRFATIVVAAGIGLGCCALADAGAKAGAGADRADADRGAGGWTEAQSLRELPAGIQALLGVGLAPDNGGIADRELHAFDAGMGAVKVSEVSVALRSAPPRRFTVGTFSEGKAVVAVEQGGNPYSVWGLEFREAGGTWEVTRCGWLRSPPRRGPELLEALDAGLPAEGWICPGPGRLTQVRPRPGT
jgi:hypothetical protein